MSWRTRTRIKKSDFLDFQYDKIKKKYIQAIIVCLIMYKIIGAREITQSRDHGLRKIKERNSFRNSHFSDIVLKTKHSPTQHFWVFEVPGIFVVYATPLQIERNINAENYFTVKTAHINHCKSLIIK